MKLALPLCLAALAPCLALSVGSFASAPKSKSASQPAPQETPAQKAARMKWWKEARFGLFLHWGLYAVPSGEWNGKTNYAEWILEEAHIPVSQYEHFESQFNPVKFDADKWVLMAKNAGMKYIVITSKHHEGFNMFASKYSNYNIMNTPFKRDVMKELAAACHRHGLKMCFYHSIMDWHHPDYLPRRSWEDRPVDGADFRKYVQYLRNEVTQLLTDYGPIGIMWFDGEWESTWTHEDGQPLYDLCRQLQPNVIVNNRVDVGRSGVAGMSTTPNTAGDYGTPEQEIPPQGIPGSYWETCMTMNDHWGYNKNDHNYKSSQDLIRNLSDISSKGGNFLLNIGPTPEGEFPPLAQDRLKDLGAWMKVNGDAIYATDASPFEHLDWGRCTVGTTGGYETLFLHVFDWPSSGQLVVPGVGNKAVKAFELAHRGESLAVKRDGGNLVISVPASAPDPNCSVVALQIEGKPIIYTAPKIVASTTLVVGPVIVSFNTGTAKLDVRYTTDGSLPTANSPRYVEPITVSDSATVKAQSFVGSTPVSDVVSQVFVKTSPRAATSPSSVSPGLSESVYAGTWDTVPDFSAMTPKKKLVATKINLAGYEQREFFGLVDTGFISVPEDGVYNFTLSSDDGSRLTIDGDFVIDDDGLHAMTAKEGSVALAKGYHSIKVEYFNKTGGSGLTVEWAKAGEKPYEIKESELFHSGE